MGADADEFVITGLCSIVRHISEYQEVERVCAKSWAGYEPESPPILSLFTSYGSLSVAST